MRELGLPDVTLVGVLPGLLFDVLELVRLPNKLGLDALLLPLQILQLLVNRIRLLRLARPRVRCLRLCTPLKMHDLGFRI